MIAPSLTLADGSVVAVVAADARTAGVVRGVAATMGLRSGPVADRTVVVCTSPSEASTGADPNAIVCALHHDVALPPGFHHLQVALAIALDAESRGGMLLHAALAVRDDAGVILAGPSGMGKSTASSRLPPPWRSPCDDTALVVRDGQGRYFAHPWPTWSRVFAGDGEQTWSVPDAVPLRAVCFLAQADRDHAEPVPRAQAASRLFESSSQALRHLGKPQGASATRANNLRRFDRACALALAVPCFALSVSPDGAFWHELDRILDGRAMQ